MIRHYFIATAAIYVPCCVYPWLRTAFEYGFTQKAHIHIEDNGFIRLTIPASNMRWRPGQHCFLRFTSFGLQAFSSHPFTICSLPAIRPNEPSELVFYIRQSHGLTKKLFAHAQKQPGAAVPVLVDGPYGGINLQRFNEADRLLVVAGGSGAGWILPMIELFCRQNHSEVDGKGEKDLEAGTKETQSNRAQHRRSLKVVLATRDTDSRTWFVDTTAKLLAEHSSWQQSSSIDIEIHLTGEAEQNATHTNSTVIQRASSSSSDDIEVNPKNDHITARSNELRGRPNLPLIIHQEGVVAAEESRSLGVYVCGPTTMQHEVRNAVAKENFSILKGSRSGSVYLHSEHFSWA
ncbi:FAD-binding domain [Ascochyta clinopodiicola]|nr:FAD-binding domain [Ascochyta clinopodiicola]